MTIDGNSLSLSAYSPYSSSSYSTAKTQNSSADDSSSTSSSSTTSSLVSSSSELSEEEKLYDADGDGVLSATEEAAYLQAQAEKKTAEVSTSGANSEEKEKQMMKKMYSESSFRQSEIFGNTKQTSDKPDGAFQSQNQMHVANEAYKAQQITDNSSYDLKS